MAISPRTMRIGGATFVAVFLVVGAYVLPGISVPQTKEVNAELTDDILASYIAKDVDQDGLPDWQEALYGTDPTNPDSNNDGITDGEAVRQGLLTPNALATQLPNTPIGEEDIPGVAPAPGSITERFSQAFLQAYLAASNGQPLSGEAQQALIDRLLSEFSTTAQQYFKSNYTLLALRTNPNTSFTTYIASVESILRANEIAGTDGDALTLMNAFIEEGDESAGPKLERIARAHNSIAQELLAMPVPPAYAATHLTLAQSFDSLSKTVRQVTLYEQDPMSVLGAVAQYRIAAEDMSRSIETLATDIIRTGEPPAGMPGYLLVYIARTIQGL